MLSAIDDSAAPAAPAYQCNGQPVSSARFYAVACDPARHVAVEACAGAGKTWMLVSRIVRALLAGVPAHEILAISFTRKAAGEMRARLDQWLAEFAQMERAELEEQLARRGLDAAAAPALQGLYAQLLRAGRTVQIRTFHGWFWTLLANAPMSLLDRLGLPANAELQDDDSELVAQVWRRFHAALLRDPAAHADYLALVAQHGRFKTQAALDNVLRRRIEFTLADEQGVVERSVETVAQRFPQFAAFDSPLDALLQDPACRAALQEAADALGRASGKTPAKAAAELAAALSAHDATAVLSALLTQKGESRKFSDKTAGIERVAQAQDLARAALEAQVQHDAHRHQQRLTRLARVLLDEYASSKRERGAVDMNDVELAARHLLADPVLGGYLQQRLDARVRQLLIDEFQDTNPLQWQALLAWLSGYVGAGGGRDGPCVFIVGDPKQSIYRFRRAEPQVFRAAQAFVRDGLGGDLLACDHTRRNAPGLIQVINAVLGQAQQAGEFSGFRAHTTASTAAGELLGLPPIARALVAPRDAAPADTAPRWRDTLSEPRVLPEETLAQLECQQAAAWIADQLAQARIAPRDVLVLARKRAPLALLEAELRARHIAATQPEKIRLADAPEVQDIVALLDALVSTGHDLSLARALRSPLFGLSDAALVQIALAKRGQPGASWFDLLQQQARDAPGAPAQQPGPGQTLARWKGWIDRLPPHDALAAIYDDGDVLARFAAAAPAPLRGSVLANLRALLSAALREGGARYATPYALVRLLRGRYGPKAPASGAPDAVQLLTVHGAKGLEARVVLLLDADSQVRQRESMGVLVDWPGEQAAPTRLVFLASEAAPSRCCAALLAAEQAARQREELNALYVAMTRASEQLVVSSIEALPRAGTAPGWRARLAAHGLPDAPATIPEAADGTGAATTFMMPELPSALAGKADNATEEIAIGAEPETCDDDADADADADADDADDEPARIGRALHRLLEWAPLAASAVPAAQVAAVAQEFALSGAQAARAAAMAGRILGGAAAWAWDPARIDWHDNEVGLVHAGRALRLDRLVRVRGSGHWWVLDYKSAYRPHEQAALVAQLRRYRAALRAARPQAVVHIAFLGADGSLREID